MNITNFDFNLPKSLITSYPNLIRSNCRLMFVNGINGKLKHGIFTDLLKKLNCGDLLVLNDTRVIYAKLYGQKYSGGKIEILVERILDNKRVLALIKSSRPVKLSSLIFFDKNIKAVLLSKKNEFFEIEFKNKTIFEVMDQIGHIPLPPYINRVDEDIDREFYQTVYNSHAGSIASPTAGLHFDQKLLIALKLKGIKIAFITLHIGSDTFKPVRTTNILNHKMHSEYTEVSQDVINEIILCKKRGNKIVAVGTTVVRSLESTFQYFNESKITPFFGYTKLFIYPGYHYRIIDAIITNFHLPKSTLLMLVSAFVGHKNIMNAYNEAILKRYGFFSYGDAMFITKKN